ncbi:putative UDP-Glycosyltransferase superfamily protein [Hibiscus syriacus]|uniref:UDP-Glycosyltransferase superfamily protein n=1 Tax=Hibiscus syriacus TaxID=106335 RepID=A0A6A3AKH8_HIBSY|nr:putative UDP-Glycosyltransferase superfamily protein [Hibiscus syriacus]
MSKSNRSKLHIAMFPWVAYGHFIPFLHLSNKLAHKGHKISFLSPKGVQPELENMNQFPNLIQFFPLVLPQVDGLSPVTFSMTVGMAIKPKKLTKETTLEEAIELPPVYPSSTVRFNVEETPALLVLAEDFGSGLSLQERMNKSMIGSDVVAFRSYRELDGPFLDYVAQESGKLVLLSGPRLPETKTQQLDDKWVTWLSQFEPGSVVFCAFGSQSELQKDEFQELVLGFELCGLPFLVALKPPKGCSTVEEALPEGFKDRVKGRGLVYGGWVPQQLLLHHPNIGCFVNHSGYGSMWEFLLSDCQIMLIPEIFYHILNTRLMVNELKIGVEVERGKNWQVSKESLNEAIEFVMNKDNETANLLRANRVKLKQTFSKRDLQ